MAEPWLRDLFRFRTSGSAYESYSYGMPPPPSSQTPAEDRYTSGTTRGGG